jgi:general secretion pathway protein G
MVMITHKIKDKSKGFTLIELLVVMAIIALLLTIATPKYFGNVDRSRETVLHQDLTTMREALDKYYGDTGQYPDALEDLVTKKYLRFIPRDPITELNTTWIIVSPTNGAKGLVYDVKSGAAGNASDGTAFSEW